MKRKTPFDIHLQWFAEPDPSAIPPLLWEGEEEEEEEEPKKAKGKIEEEEEEEELEIFVEGEDELPKAKPAGEEDLPEEVRGKSKKELYDEMQALKGQADTSSALTKAIEGLGEKLATPQRTPAQAVKEIEETFKADPEFAARFNKDLFGDNPIKVVAELVEMVSGKVAEKKAAQMIGTVAQSTAGMAKKMLMNEPGNKEIFETYGKEIEGEIAALEVQTPGVRNNPQVYEYALNQIKLRHFDEISVMRAEALLEEKPKKKETKPQFSERGAAPGGRKAKRQIVVEGWERKLCYLRGIPADAYAVMKADGSHFDKETGEFTE